MLNIIEVDLLEVAVSSGYWLTTAARTRGKTFLRTCWDMNGHVGSSNAGYEGTHGGLGYGSRNADGSRILEFADGLNRLHWYGHVLRKADDDWVKKCMEYEVQVQDLEENQRGPGERLSDRIVKHVK